MKWSALTESPHPVASDRVDIDLRDGPEEGLEDVLYRIQDEDAVKIVINMEG